MEQGINEQFELNGTRRTTIAIREETKKKLDQNRLPGQCYNEFISELVEYWKRYLVCSSLCGPGKAVRQIVEK
jgi:hypothetical protein